MIEEEEDEEPIVITELKGQTYDIVSMCLLGKLWTNRSFNMFGLMETMKKLWGPTQGVSCRELGHNLISFQFKSKRDMKRVLDMEPWHFNKHILVLKQFTGDTQPSAMKIDKTPFWIRVYDLPMVGREEKVLKQIGARFGEVIDIDRETMNGISRSVRMKILLKLEHPLKRGTKIKIGNAESCWITVTYERLPYFCYSCGKLGHTYKDCLQRNEKYEEDEVIEDDLSYGDWMRASPMKMVRNVLDRNSEGNDKMSHAIFTPRSEGIKSKTRVESEIQIEPEVRTETKERKCGEEEDQVSELLNGLQRVEVSGGNEEKHITTNKQTKNPSANIIHLTTKTSITQTKNLSPGQTKNLTPDLPTKIMHPEEMSTTKLTPFVS